MKFYIKNKENAEAGNDLKEPHVIISINFPRTVVFVDECEEVAVPATNEYTKEVLSLFFSDVGRLSNPYDDDAKSNPRCVPFNKEMAC